MNLYLVWNPRKKSFACRVNQAIHLFAKEEDAQREALRTGGDVQVMVCDLGGEDLGTLLERYLETLIRRWKVARMLTDYGLAKWVKQESTQDVKLAAIAKADREGHRSSSNSQQV